MSSELDQSGEGTDAVVQKLDALSASVDSRFATLSASVDERFATLSASVDKRFDAVDEALIEQRQYAEFAFDRLRGEMTSGFQAINGRLDGVDGRFDSVERRFDGVARRFDSVERRFDRLERKIDQFIDTQSKANELVERRLTALEAPAGQE